MSADLNEAIAEMLEEAFRTHLGGIVVKKRLYTAKEAGVYLGRTEDEIEGMVREGHLEVTSHDSEILIDILELDRYCTRFSHRWEPAGE